MGTHTPGPWSVGRDSNYPSSFGIIEGPSFPISYVLYATDVTFEMGEQRDRDARLIASAPALLEALEGIRDWVSDAAERKSYFSQASESIVALACDALARIDAALNLARTGAAS